VIRILFNYGKGIAPDGKQENFFLRAGDIVWCREPGMDEGADG